MMVILKIVAVLLILSTQVIADEYKNVKIVYSWKTLEYGFHRMEDRDDAIKSGHYTNDIRYPVDVGVGYLMDGSMKTIVTVPRYISDSPYSLAIVSNESTSNGPVLYPYPNYSWQNQYENCSLLTSVERVAVDECNRLWAIDSGMVKGKQVCPPQVVVFNLINDQMVHRHTFDSTMYIASKSLFINIIVDTLRGRCSRTMAYIADGQRPSLIVYNSLRRTAWRIENKYMFMDKDWEKFSIAGEKFNVTGGIHGMALSPKARDKKRFLYFHPLSGNMEICIELRTVNNQSLWMNNPQGNSKDFKVVGKRNVQSITEAMDSKGNLFTSTADPLSVFVWNTMNPYNMDSVVANNPEDLQFLSGMKVLRDREEKEYLWLMSNEYQKSVTGTLDPNVTNYRIMCDSTERLLSRIH